MTTDKDMEDAIEKEMDSSANFAKEILAVLLPNNITPVFSRDINAAAILIRGHDARIRAEAKAETLREAAENAVDWVHQEYPKQDDPVRQQAIDDSLRAAVRAVEHCNNPAQTRKDWAKEVITPLRHWIENTHGDLPASRLTGYEVMEIFSILADEPNKEE